MAKALSPVVPLALEMFAMTFQKRVAILLVCIHFWLRFFFSRHTLSFAPTLSLLYIIRLIKSSRPRVFCMPAA